MAEVAADGGQQQFLSSLNGRPVSPGRLFFSLSGVPHAHDLLRSSTAPTRRATG
jgi:hypothetical protein